MSLHGVGVGVDGLCDDTGIGTVTGIRTSTDTGAGAGARVAAHGGLPYVACVPCDAAASRYFTVCKCSQ
jgi:hypothetical protein